ncbi:hypothetical protein [Legionella londiniensis]|uniref:Uncharacterized protein n=1 Tax=Legionella londiniensis TaxID=45068 RepID=A0A0W0VJ90_9GAMM|nr:hypothetical protein [Legionella londiniensis]KTD19926.1 hypothetical protein Llon_2098 [Legionella londiniensis]STX94201.1 Uncharacterised protein [Legionella londiniensis]
MKTWISTFIVLGLMLFSLPTFADKIIITGAPVILEQREGIYYLPTTYTATTPYYYVTLDGANRVCYTERQPALETLDMTTINVNVAGTQTLWYCYLYDTTYFSVTP